MQQALNLKREIRAQVLSALIDLGFAPPGASSQDLKKLLAVADLEDQYARRARRPREALASRARAPAD